MTKAQHPCPSSAPHQDCAAASWLPSLQAFLSLQAFVRMVGHHATFLEAHVRQAEHNCGAFPQTLRRWLGSVWPSSFRKVSIHP